jgi:hypothetical protein
VNITAGISIDDVALAERDGAGWRCGRVVDVNLFRAFQVRCTLYDVLFSQSICIHAEMIGFVVCSR